MEPDETLVTTAQACRELGMSWHTYSKWCKRLGIASSVEHPYDRRLRMVPQSTIDRIKEARASMPVKATAPRPYIPPLARSQPTERPAVPRVTPTPRPRVVIRKLHPKPLPDGWLPFNELSRRLGLREANQGSGHERSLERAVPPMRAPKGEPWGSWRPSENRWYDVYSAYTPEQQAIAEAYAREHWG